MKESQDKIKEFDRERGWENSWNIKDLCLNMNEEIGELWNLIKWVDEDKQKEIIMKNHAEAKDFIGDALWIILKMANQMNVDAKAEFDKVVEEYKKRMPADKIKEIGHANKFAGGYDEKKKEEIIVKEFLGTVYPVKDGKVLLTFNKKVQNFVPLGGHTDKNELPCDCAIREAKEESGYDVKLIDAHNFRTSRLPQNLTIGLDVIMPDHHHINIGYVGIVVGGEELDKSDEDTELRWFSREDLELAEGLLDNVKESSLKALEIVSKVDFSNKLIN